MAKKGGKTRRAIRYVKAAARRSTPRGGRLSIMFKTAVAVAGAALVGGAALNMVNASREKPAEGFTAGVTTFGAGALLAFLLGMFRGTRQYVTPVLAGATAVGTLAALNGPLSRGSANVANALLGKKTETQTATGPKGPVGQKGIEGPAGPSSTAKRASKGEQLIGLATSVAQLGAGIAQSVAGRSGGMTAGQRAAQPVGSMGDDELDGAEGLDDYNVGSGELDGSEGMDDFAIVGSAMMGDD